jgi:uncharacterized protein
MAKFIIKYRWLIIVLFPFAGIFFALLVPGLQTEPDMRNYTPALMESRVATDTIESEFGVQDIVMIIFTSGNILEEDNLVRIRGIDNGLSRITGISRKMSPFTMKTTRGEDGGMVVENLISKIPSNKAEENEVAGKIMESSFASDVVFSSDLKAASIIAFIDPAYAENEVIEQIDSVIAAHPGRAEVITGGLPYIRQYIMKDVRKDGMLLVPAALLIMLLILRFSLKDWKSVMMPFSVVLVSTAASIGLIPLIGWKLSLMTLLAPVILIAVANNYGIYLTARYQEISQDNPGITGQGMIERLTRSLNTPIMFSGLTTIAGISGLLTHSVTAARQVGILAASGVVLALVMSLMFIPAVVYFRKAYRNSHKENKRDDFLRKLSVMLADVVTVHPGRILIMLVFIIIASSAGITLIRIDTSQESYFPSDHPVRAASASINKNFGGSQAISVMIEGNIKDPQVMKGIDTITLVMKNQPGVGGVFSVSQAVREMSKAIYDKDERGYDAIPGSGEAIAQFFELYNMSGDPDDFRQILSFDNTKAHLLIRLSNPENRNIKSITSKLQELGKDLPAKITIGGYAVIMSDFAELIIRGQVYSLVFALSVVFILLTIIFRSFRGALIGLVPLLASILVLFGFMGVTGIAIDAATALLSSIMIGVGVDFTIQYIWCFNSFIRSGADYKEAVRKAHATIGRSIIINAVSVMAGFSVLIFSEFLSIRFFGYLVTISIGSCLLGALIVVPALLVRFRPAFVRKAQSTEHRAQSTEHKAQSTEHRATEHRATEHRAQSTEHRAQSTEHRAQSTEHRAQSNRAQSTEHRATEHRAQSRGKQCLNRVTP